MKNIADWIQSISGILTIASSLIIIVPLLILKIRKRRERPETLAPGTQPLVNLNTAPQSLRQIEISSPEFSQFIPRIKILLIDDNPQQFPTSSFKKEGYNITIWKKMELFQDLENCEYDIIIMDISGISAHLEGDDGLTFIRQLKSSDNQQIIIAFSGQDDNFQKKEFWTLANDAIQKPITSFMDCKIRIDQLINELITPEKYIERIIDLARKNNLNLSRSQVLEYICEYKSNGRLNLNNQSLNKLTPLHQGKVSSLIRRSAELFNCHEKNI